MATVKEILRNRTADRERLEMEAPNPYQGFNELMERCYKPSALERKYKELMAVTASVATRCSPVPGHSHVEWRVGGSDARRDNRRGRHRGGIRRRACVRNDAGAPPPIPGRSHGREVRDAGKGGKRGREDVVVEGHDLGARGKQDTQPDPPLEVLDLDAGAVTSR